MTTNKTKHGFRMFYAEALQICPNLERYLEHFSIEGDYLVFHAADALCAHAKHKDLGLIELARLAD